METAQKQVTFIPAKLEKRKKRVAAYARVSSDSEDQLHSFKSQVQHYTRLIQENEEWEFAGMYADEGISGLSGNRKGFQQLLRDCREGKIDTVIVKSVSRFYRNSLENLATVRELKRCGVSVIFEKESYDTGRESDETLLALYGMQAQRESMAIASNLRMGNRMRMKNGTFSPGSAPYGFAIKNKCLVINETEAAVVRRIYDMYLSGHGQEQIARTLAAEGIPPKYRREAWGHNSIAYILRNPANVGDSLWQKTYSEGDTRIKRYQNKGALPQYLIEDSHPAIVDRETFRRAQELGKARAEQYQAQDNKPRFFLNRRLRCGCCQTLFRAKSSGGNGRRWSCRKHDQRAEDCPMMPVAETEIHKAFLRVYNNLALNRDAIFPPLLKQLRALQDARHRHVDDIKSIERRIQEVNLQNATVSAMFDRGFLTPDCYFEKVTPLKDELGELHSAKRRILQELRGDSMLEGVEQLMEALENGPPWLDAFSEEMFGRLVQEITVNRDDSIRIQLTGGLSLTERIRREARHGKV